MATLPRRDPAGAPVGPGHAAPGGAALSIPAGRFRNRGISILLVEQKLDIALDISERCYVMGHGRIVFEGSPQDVKKDAAMRKEWLEV